jgi:polysaccharide pyruvyl transferase WcaK-like protein
LQEVLIIHVGSVTNKGTLALVKAQSSELRRIFPAVRIAASTCDVEEFKALVPDVTPVSLLIDIPHEKADINARNQKIDRDSHLYKLLLIAYSIRMLLEIPVCLMSSLIYHLGFKGTYKSSVISYIAGSDFIISTADENFKEGASELPYNIYWRFVSWTTLLSRTLEVLISKHVFKKSIIVFPNSIGPFRTLAGRFLGKLIFNNIDLLLLRERYSLEWVKKLSLKTPTIVTSDIALVNDIPKPHTTNPDEDYKPLLAVCPGIYAAALSQTQQNNYLTAHVRALDEFIDEYGVRVIFLPLEITGRKNDDYSFCKSILEKMRNSAFAEIVKTKSLEDFCARVSQTELMLSSRMHPTVIASSCRVPVVVITYDYKQLGLMEQLGLDRYVIDVNKVTYENMISTMEKAWKNRRFIREHLELQIPILQDLVRDKIAAACNPYRRR